MEKVKMSVLMIKSTGLLMVISEDKDGNVKATRFSVHWFVNEI